METGLETKVAFGDFMQAFEAFKEANDERLAQIEQRMARRRGDRREGRPHQPRARRDQGAARRADAEGAAPAPVGGGRRRRRAAEHKEAFETYVRKGETQGAVRARGQGACRSARNADGGYLVPAETETEIGRRLCGRLADPRHRRRAAGVVGRLQEALRDHRRRHRLGGRDRGAAARPRRRRWPNCSFRRWSSTPCRRRPRRCSTMRRSISTSGSPRKCSRPSPSRRARPSSPATASTSRKGFLDYTKVADASWTWGKLGYIATGVAGALCRASNPSDMLIDLVYALKSGYRQNAHWVMNRKTQARSASSRMPTAIISGSRRLGRRRPRHADGLSRGRGRGHAGYRRQRHRRSPSAISAAAI